jgi:Tfp pilus assembly protein PilF
MTRSIFRLLILSALSLAALPVFAQRGEPDVRSVETSITGQVRYAEGGGPAFNVTVELNNFNGGGSVRLQTDRNGKFNFPGVTCISCTVTVRVPGYKEEQQFVDLSMIPTQYVVLVLKSDGSGAARPAPPAVIDPKAPEPARKEYQAGLDEMNKGKAEKAIPHLEKAVSLYPQFQQAYLLLGQAYIDQKQWNKAEVTLIQALKVDPNKTEAYFMLGDMYYQQKNYPGAERALVGGLQIDDNNWQAHYTLARVYLDANAAVRGVPHIEKANKLRPDYADAHITAANIYIKSNNPEGALKEFQTYLHLAPKGKFAAKAQENVAKLKEMLKK